MLTTSNAVGGAERAAVQVTLELRRRGWQVRSMFPSQPENAEFEAWSALQGDGLESNPAVPHWGSPHTLVVLLSLRRLVHESQPAIVNLVYGGYFISLTDVIAVRLGGSQRCVVTVQHPITWDRQNQRKRMMTYLASLWAHQIIVGSNATRDSLVAAGVSRRKIHVVPPPAAVPTSLPDRTEARARLGLPEDAFVVACLARLSEEKHIDDLIRAAADVPQRAGRLQLVVAGTGGQFADLKNLADTHLGARATFLGHLVDTSDLYAAADVFVLPSTSEGFGLVFIEAAYHGVPSIGVRAGGVSEAIADGETGLLVPPRDVPALAQAIGALRDDAVERRRMGRQARVRALSVFTPDSIAARYEAVLDQKLSV